MDKLHNIELTTDQIHEIYISLDEAGFSIAEMPKWIAKVFQDDICKHPYISKKSGLCTTCMKKINK